MSCIKEFENKRKLHGTEKGCKHIKGTITIKETQMKSIIKCAYLCCLLT